MFLLDTNVISELVKGAKADAGVLRWIDEVEENSLYLSVITFGEIRKGIEKVGDPTKRLRLESFYEAMRARFEERIIPVDLAIAERWGALSGRCEASGTKIPIADALIGATALEHSLALVTRNIGDFQNIPIAAVNPWSGS
jgi:hypothetical protein